MIATIYLLFPLLLLVMTFFVGRAVEKQHCADLDAREAGLRRDGLVMNDLKAPPDALPDRPGMLVTGEVTIASDYLKNFLAALRKLIGGHVKSDQTLVDRARREALLRMCEEAWAEGYNGVCNVRIVSADIGGNAHSKTNKGSAMVTVLASGTAYRRRTAGDA